MFSSQQTNRDHWLVTHILVLVSNSYFEGLCTFNGMETWPMTQQNSLTNIRHDGKCSWLLSLLLLFLILLFRLRCYERQTCFSAYGDVGLTLLYQEGNVEHVLDACAKTVRIQNKFEIVHRLFPRLLELGENMGHHLLQWTSHLQFILSYYTVRGRHIATNQPATITRLRFLGWRSRI